MSGIGKSVGGVLLLAALIDAAAATVPEKSIAVRFRSGGCVLPHDDAVGMVYQLQPTGRLLSGERLMDELSSPLGTSNERIAEAIDNGSRLGTQLCIFLTIGQPEHTYFSTIMESVERLKRLAATNAAEGCRVEIIVLPAAKVTWEPPLEPASQQGIDEIRFTMPLPPPPAGDR